MDARVGDWDDDGDGDGDGSDRGDVAGGDSIVVYSYKVSNSRQP